MQSSTSSSLARPGRDQTRSVRQFARTGLLVVQAFVALTAIAGGSALIIGSLLPQTAIAIVPPGDYLVGTPFSSYLIPGLVLGVVVGGLHVAAFVLELSRSNWRTLAAATAGFALLIWIFVQMVFIPFSFLQAVYFVAGLAEIGLVMLVLGITELTAPDRETRLP